MQQRNSIPLTLVGDLYIIDMIIINPIESINQYMYYKDNAPDEKKEQDSDIDFKELLDDKINNLKTSLLSSKA